MPALDNAPPAKSGDAVSSVSDGAGSTVAPQSAAAVPEGAGTLRRRLRAGFVFLVLALSTAIAGGAVHVVSPGETLAEIAADHDTTVAELADANGLADPDFILAGQQLTIPGTQRIHVVTRGDTVGEIAAAYGSSIAAIVDANGLSNAHLIRVGQELILPDESGTNGEDAPLYHLVQRGESLASIAAKHGISVQTLAAANGMTPDSIIFVGTRLRLTPAPEFSGDTGGSATHIVKAGESLGEIAASAGTTVGRLVELNNLANPDLIRIGQRLVVPGGGFVCPVPGAKFFNDWGFPRSGGRFHQGNDMFAPGGTPVLAPVSGRVEQITGTIGGLQFWLYGDDGNLYIGTHMASFGAEGRVSAGTVVGTVGDSGNARGARPHLHFEVMIGGEQNINPYPLIVAACR